MTTEPTVAPIVQAPTKGHNGIWSSFATEKERKEYGRYLNSLRANKKGGRPRNTAKQDARTKFNKATRKARKVAKAKAEKLQRYGCSPANNAAYDIFPASIVEFVHGQSPPLMLQRTDTGCIVPIDRKANSTGYYTLNNARFTDSGVAEYGRKREALHRLAYKYLHGPIPDGFDIDHMCRNPPCCNPRHLQALRRDEHAMLTAFNARSRAMERVHMQWLMLSRRTTPAHLSATLDMSLERVTALLAEAIAQDHEDRRRWGLIAA